MLRRGVGDAEAQRLPLGVLQDAIRPRAGEARLGEVLPGELGIEGSCLEICVGEGTLARSIAVEALIVTAQQGRDHLVDGQRMLDAEPHIEILEQRIGGVEVEPGG
ncbi:hypothetical protein D3C77_602160 [compost metagenome]